MKRSFGRANPLLYFPLYWGISTYYRLVNRVSFDTAATKNLQGPAVLLCTHPNFFDFIHAAMVLYPHRPTIVMNRMYYENPELRGLLKPLAVIPKRLFCADAESIHGFFSAVRNNRFVVMMPEGRLSSSGQSFPVCKGTGKLIKKLKVPVYRINAEGAYFVRPKWSKSTRFGNIHIKTELLLSAEDVKAMSEQDINVLLDEKMRYLNTCIDELRFCKDRTKGLDGLLFVCPECGREYTLQAENNRISCSACGSSVYMERNCTFTGGKFKHLHEWYDYQTAHVEAQMDSIQLSVPVKVSRMAAYPGRICPVGEGVATLNKDKFEFKGNIDGLNRELSVSTKDMDGLPYDCGKGFEYYFDSELYFFYPKENPNQSVQWSMLVDALAERRRKISGSHT